MEIVLKSRYRSFGGWVEFYSSFSQATGTDMKFSVYRPPQAETGRVPTLYWLSGLTCTEENFTTKAGAQKYAAEQGVFLVAPDTSPRGAGIPGEDKDWSFGLGAGYYVNATENPWSKNYRMEDYVATELPALVEKCFPVIPGAKSIAGHSMGGHGALVLSLRHPGMYASVSAFSPIVAPSQCPWGINAFTQFLGTDREKWKAYDATELIRAAKTPIPFKIDQGGDDAFLKEQLRLELFQKTVNELGYPAEITIHPGYDHSYYFVSSFIGTHIAYHAKALHGITR